MPYEQRAREKLKFRTDPTNVKKCWKNLENPQLVISVVFCERKNISIDEGEIVLGTCVK